MEDYVVFKSNNQRPAVADITPDGRKVAVVGKDINQVHIYDIEQNVIIQTLDDTPKEARWVSFSRDLSYFAALSIYAQCFLWNLETGERHLADRFNPEHSAYWSVCFHPNSKYMASGSLVGFIVIFRLNDGERVVMQKVHEGRVSDLALTPDGKKLISGGEDGLLSILESNDILYHEG